MNNVDVEEIVEDESNVPDDHANRNYKDSVFTDLFYEDEKAKEKED